MAKRKKDTSIEVKFKISKKDYERAKKYIPQCDDLMPLSYLGYISFMEYLKRKEGRDRRAKEEALAKDADRIQEVLNSGKVQVPGEIIS